MKTKHTILMAALALLYAGSATAQTNVAIVGLVDMFAGSTKRSGDAAHKKVVNGGGMSTSHWGFKGVEDLGGGLRAEFTLTSFVRADTGEAGRSNTDNLFSQHAHIGLAGSFGKIQLGRAPAPNFLPTILFNPFGDSFSFSPLVLHSNVPSGTAAARTWAATNAGDTGWSNQITYSTPNFNGLRANIHFQPGEVEGQSGRNNFGMNVLYFRGAWGVAAYHQNVEVANPNPGLILDAATAPINFASIAKQTSNFVGASYDAKIVKLFGTARRTEGKTANSRLRMNDTSYSLGLSMPLRGGSLLLAYALTNRDGSLIGRERSRTTATIGYDYFLSKRTDLYAVVMNDKLNTAANAASGGFGVRHRF